MSSNEEVIAKNIVVFRSERFKQARNNPAKRREISEDWLLRGVGGIKVVKTHVSEEGEILYVPVGYRTEFSDALENPALIENRTYEVSFDVGGHLRVPLLKRMRFNALNKGRESYLITDYSTVFTEVIPGFTRDRIVSSVDLFNEIYGFVWPWKQKH